MLKPQVWNLGSWLRASLRRVNEKKPGIPVLGFREPVAVWRAQRVVYRIPIVANARRIAVNRRLRLVLATADETHKGVALLGFTHTVLCEASVNTIYSASRLLLPVLS
jgi:hypothetical protein